MQSGSTVFLASTGLTTHSPDSIRKTDSVPQSMATKVLFLLFTSVFCLAGSTFCFGTAGGAEASPKHPPLELYHQVAEAQAAAEKGNIELREKMELVAGQFKKYRLRAGSFPEPGHPTENLSRRLEQLAGTNPFASFPVRTAADESDFAAKHSTEGCTKENICVCIRSDANLSNFQINSLRGSVPEDWQAMPGTITVIHNTENLFALWGAGVDGKPIRDKTNSQYLIVSIEI
jgi:hypothetical protein